MMIAHFRSQPGGCRDVDAAVAVTLQRVGDQAG